LFNISELGDQRLRILQCDSGKGVTRAKTGIYGMRRAFALAGAESLVMSLWKVPDLQTREFMQVFYHRILNGDDRLTALHSTKHYMKLKYKSPFYWASFILQGKTVTLKMPL
jgi:CHAT domain-containing protein